MTIERNGEIFAAAFPYYALRIVRVPFHDPDRDGMVNGWTHALKFEPREAGPFAGIESSVWGSGIGATGSVTYLRELLRRCVDRHNEHA